MQKRYLFTPGPTPVPPEVLAAEAEPMVHHRGADFREIYERTLERLQRGLTAPRPGAALQRVGHRRDGVRGREPHARGRPRRRRRRGRVRRALDEDLRAATASTSQRIDYEWGEVPDPAEIGVGGRARAGAGVVFCTQSETSTGVVADVQAIKAAVGDATLVVDAVSSLGAVPLETDAWGDRRRRLRLAEGADVPARPRDGLGRRPPLGHAAAVAHVLLRLAGDEEGAGGLRRRLHPGGLADPRPRRRARR